VTLDKVISLSSLGFFNFTMGMIPLSSPGQHGGGGDRKKIPQALESECLAFNASFAMH
jgi:hypothetical protein